ncbi:MAG: hypothetical protein V7K67_34325 [Nostoc sp.]|uniref:hypothetical protein n=1 Tax=Nostoc sp. TaxID=1180 RepID=UPI002FFA34C5
MRSLRFIFIGIITFLFVTNIVFLRRIVSVLLCGVMGFNPVSSYYLLHNYGKAEAASPSSRVAALDNVHTVQEEEQKQKVADCFLGICINIPKIPTGNQPRPTASSQYSDEYQKDFDNFPQQPPIPDLTGTWIRSSGAGFHIDQRGCTAGIIGTLTVDGKEPPKHKFTLTQNHNQLSRPDETISYNTGSSSGSYGQNYQGKISGNRIIFLANSPSFISKIIGIVNDTGDSITGQVYCKTARGSATAQGTFTWKRLTQVSITVYLGGAGMNGSYIPDQIEALKDAGVQNVVEGKYTWGAPLDAIDSLYIKRLHNYVNSSNQPFTLDLLGIKDNGETPLNFIGYSYGSLVAAQCAIYYATHGRKVGKLVLIGSPIAKNFLDELKSNPNIEGIIIVDLTQYSDEIHAGMSFTELDHIGLIKLVKDMKNSWGHFYYALENDEGKKRRRDLANKLWKDGLR